MGGARTTSELRRGTLEQGNEHSNVHIGPCNELATHSGLYPAFTRMQLGKAPASSLWPGKRYCSQETDFCSRRSTLHLSVLVIIPISQSSPAFLITNIKYHLVGTVLQQTCRLRSIEDRCLFCCTIQSEGGLLSAGGALPYFWHFLHCCLHPFSWWLMDTYTLLLPDPLWRRCGLLAVSYPVSYQLLLSLLNSPCPLQEKEVVEDLPKEQEEEDVTTVRTSTSQEEVGLERLAGGCSWSNILGIASVKHRDVLILS